MQNTVERWSGLDARTAMDGSRVFGMALPARAGARSGGVTGYSLIDYAVDKIAPCPWAATVGSTAPLFTLGAGARRPLYTPDERRRRDDTVWTTVQAVLAPIQFLVFLVSLAFVLNFLWTGEGYAIATASVVAKTLVLYTIMVTGSIWEKKVYGQYLFAPAFFWEDAVSMLVITLHTLYLIELLSGSGAARALMLLAVAAYVSYVVNAGQFLLKLRAARLGRN